MDKIIKKTYFSKEKWNEFKNSPNLKALEKNTIGNKIETLFDKSWQNQIKKRFEEKYDSDQD